ncbi:MAG TPA: response regulator [Burkholderiales bacterium]|jgi:CheY-like chemotaxis protein|nr:response regulator [Burkholderiales bacterium]
MPHRRILVIDDHLDTAETMAELLRAMGHEAQFAINGSAALEIAARFRPDIVFVDLRLPDCDGCDLAARMKREGRLAGSKFFLITGQAGMEERARAVQAGCDDLFLKPIDGALLDRLIN